MANPVVALAMPGRGGAGGDTDALARGVTAKAVGPAGKYDVSPGCAWTSLLPYTFNLLWSGFLNMREGQRLTYFAMIHDDIRPDPGWLDTMIGELDRTGADIVSAVVPIKDGRGLTSTAVDDTGDEWAPRRLTMTEVFALPETFGADDAGGPLAVNTGLWVCRFDRDWCEKVGFRQQDRIVRLADGTFVPQTKPEDWDFSRQVRALGGTVLATRKVAVEHERPEWNTRHPWGSWTTDRDLTTDPRVLARAV